MSKVLVTGACGLVGERVCSGLLKKGYEVIAVDAEPSNYNASKENYTFYPVQFNESDKIKALFNENEIKNVVHLACTVDNDFGPVVTEEQMNISRSFDSYIYSAAHEANVSHMIMLSTTQIYEIPRNREAIYEDALIKPITNYAVMKRESEIAFVSEFKASKITTCGILRCAPFYTKEFYDNLTSKIINPLDNRVFVYRTGEYGFHFCCVHNLSDFIIGYLKDAKDYSFSGIYNVADAKITSASDIINFMKTNYSLGPIIQRNESKDGISMLFGKLKSTKDEKTNYRYLNFHTILNNINFSISKAIQFAPLRWNIENTK